MEPTRFEYSVKWHLLARLIPLVENNFNLCELGPSPTKLVGCTGFTQYRWYNKEGR